MADLVVPPVGESITEGIFSLWLKQVGDAVAADEPVAEIETDKITVQVLAPAAGVITAQTVSAGATVKIGEVIGALDTDSKGKAAPAKAAEPAKAAQSAAEPAKPAKPAKPDQPAAKPAAPAQASASASASAPAQAAAPASSGGNGHGAAASLDKDALLRLTPSQRASAREAGRLPAAGSAAAASAGAPAAAPAGPSADERLAHVDPRDEIVPMSPLRKRVAERLVQAQHESASLTTFNEVDMTAVMDLRGKYKDAFEKTHSTKLGFMSFFVKACVHAARRYPGVNAEVIGGNIVYKKHYDFGIAVSSPKGLVVPVLRDCDHRSFAQIEQGIAELAERARTGKLTLEDLSGGTFSITNGGIFGSMMSTPLLNYPQTGILGMHNIVKRAVVVGEQIAIRPMMYVALSYDHRVVDGREAVSFLVAVKERLEAPERLLIDA
jgi:2-oxoglutarate dehydrogenase E2 component (dihydrolipoamide succinyltransferase)